MFIQIFSAMLFAISANIDNIVIGISYGLKKIDINLKSNLIIAFFTSIATLISMYAGKLINIFLNPNIENLLGASLLIFIGTFSLIKDIIKKDKNLDSKNLKKINYIELFTIIITLSTNNIAAGIAASITGINILYGVIFTFVFCNIFMFFGNKIGSKIKSKKIEKFSSLIASLLLILLGFLQILM